MIIRSSLLLLLRSSFVPTKIPNCTLWLDASQITGLADAAAVSAWNDLSGNGNNVSQAVGGNQPVYKVNIVNSKPVVRFATNDYLSGATNGFTTTQPATLFVVGKQTSKTTGARFVDSVGAAGRQLLNLNITTGLANIYAGTNVVAASPDRSGAFHVLNGIFNGASSYFYVDGTTADIGPSNAGSQAGTVTLLVGFDNGTTYLNGDIAEIIYYSRLLSAGEKAQVDNYLGAKYAITIV